MLNCPICQTQNPINVENCTQCGQDLTLLNITKNRAFSHFNKGVEFAERQRYEEAKKELLVAVELDSSEPSFFLVLGSVCARLEELEDAKKYWEKGLETDPKYKNLHENLAKYDHFPFLSKIRRYSRILGIVAFASLFAFLAFFLLYFHSRWTISRFQKEVQYLVSEEFPVPLDYENKELNYLAKRINDGYFRLRQEMFENIPLDKPQNVPQLLKEWDFMKSTFDYEPEEEFKNELLTSLQLYFDKLFHSYDFDVFQEIFQDTKRKYASLSPDYWEKQKDYYIQRRTSNLIHTLEKKIVPETDLLLEKLRLVDGYKAEFPDERWQKLREFMVSQWWNEQEVLIKYALQKKNFDKAKDFLDSFPDLIQYASDSQRKAFEHWESLVHEERIQFLWNEFSDFFNRREWEDAYEKAEILFDHYLEELDELHREQLKDNYEIIKNRLRWRYWQELEQLHSVIISENITEEQARDIIGKAEIIFYEELPSRLYYIKDNVLVYRGFAYTIIEDYNSAQADLERVMEMENSPFRDIARRKWKEIQP